MQTTTDTNTNTNTNDIPRAAHWTRLRSGDWGVKVRGFTPPARGDVITVYKRDGSAQAAVVQSVIWTGQDSDGGPVALCSVVTATRRPKRGASTTPAQQSPAGATPNATPTGRATWRGPRRPQKVTPPAAPIDTTGGSIDEDAPKAKSTFVGAESEEW